MRIRTKRRILTVISAAIFLLGAVAKFGTIISEHRRYNSPVDSYGTHRMTR